MGARIELGASEANAEAHLRRGIALRARGDQLAAIAAFRQAIGLNARLAEAHHQLGNALKSLGRHGEAMISLRTAALLAPASGAAWLNLGVACLELRRLEEAAACFGNAVRLEPSRPEAWNVFGHGLLTLGRCEEAKRALEKALQLRPGYPAAHDNLGRLLKAQGRSAEALAHHRKALLGDPRPQVHSNLLYSLHFPAGIPAEEIAAEHRRWAERHAVPLHPSAAGSGAGPVLGRPEGTRQSHPFGTRPSGSVPRAASADGPRPGSDGRLRVGYVSPDLCRHAVAYFLEPVLAAHDRSGFEIVCYNDATAADEVTARLRSHASLWRDIAGQSDAQLAGRIRSDGIDILVDLAGHTARNRLLVFARRPAPVQVAWLGYPNTTGLEAIDYRLTDALSDPPGAGDALYTEKLVRLPGAFSCFGPQPESPPVAPPPALAAGCVTFGCFNHLAKLTPPAIDLWARLLRESPTSRLLLKSRGLIDPATAAAVRREFGRRGVEPGRIELNGEELSVAGHLALYGKVDIALDTFPYNGATTTCEALWMGVPVVTLAGATHVSRVGASMLTHLGHPEWVAGSPESYLATCVALASDLPRLSLIRQGLREQMRLSPLCDGPGFTRQLEMAFKEMWRRFVAGGDDGTGGTPVLP